MVLLLLLRAQLRAHELRRPLLPAIDLPHLLPLPHRRGRRPISRIAAIVAGISLLLILPGNLIYGATNFLITKRSHIDLGQRLAPFAQDHILFAGAAGAIPYYSGWVTYDFLGLATNRFIAPAITLPQLQHIHPDIILIFADSPGPEAAEEM